jgi:hypothetical protein
MSPLSSIQQRLMNAGTDDRQIEVLRRVLAGTEDAKVLRAVSVAVSEVAEVAADCFLEPLADLKDRVAEKLVRLGVTVPVRRASPPQDGGHVASPAIKMRLTDWVVDESGVRGRILWNASDGPTPP